MIKLIKSLFTPSQEIKNTENKSSFIKFVYIGIFVIAMGIIGTVTVFLFTKPDSSATTKSQKNNNIDLQNTTTTSLKSSLLTATATPANLPEHALLTSKAWDQLKNKKYDDAIRSAQECIEKYRSSADLMEENALQSKKPIWPTGKVPAATKEKILEQGPLNDVASCFYIIAMSQKSQGNFKDASENFLNTSKYTYARCYDPSGDFFWSPPDISKIELSHLATPKP